jgi:Conjugative transposon protein TcpC
VKSLKKLRSFQKKGKGESKIDSSKVSRKIPFSRKKATRTASILFFSVILLSLVFNVIFFSKYQSIRNSVKAQEQSIQEKLHQVKNSDMLQSHSIVVFTEDFLRHYVNIPQEDDERKKRLDTLSTYFVDGFDINRLDDLKDFKGTRTLKELQYIETERLSPREANIHFLANYEITEIMVREEKVQKKTKVTEDGKEVEKTVEETVQKEEPKTVSYSVQIVVPVITNGEGYAVYQNPHFIERDLKANIKMDEKVLQGDTITASERKQIESFLIEFFTSYGVSDEKLPFMAEVERGLQDQIFESLNIRQMVNEQGTYKAIVDVQYQHKETSLSSLYTYELVLTKENHKYFIKSIG